MVFKTVEHILLLLSSSFLRSPDSAMTTGVVCCHIWLDFLCFSDFGHIAGSIEVVLSGVGSDAHRMIDHRHCIQESCHR